MTQWSCSQKKNNFLNRFFHNTNARWNGYFNAMEAYKKGSDKIESGYKENYRKLLPLYIYGDKEMAKTVQADMDVVIKKCSRVIEYHSMDIKGKEHCKWIDDCWMLIGQAYFHEKNFKECVPIFNYVTKKYGGEKKYEARLWLIRTHLETDKLERAEVLIRTLVNDNKIPEEIQADVKATIAEFYLKQEDYGKAIIELEEAVLLQKDKEIATRWMFILAQLYAQEGESIRANTMYLEVAKRHPKYEMEFWAQMNRALSYNSEDGSSFDIKKVLLKMLRDDKNKEYRDKLYYALSKVYYQEGSEEKQIKALELSTKASVDDNYQKGLSFLELAQINFNIPEYIPAQAYYDSTVQYIPEDFPNRKEIINIKTSLTELVEQILIINREDSLLALANLPEEELDAFIEEVIEERIAQEEARRAAEEQRASQISDDGFVNDFSDDKGAWYFYNERNIKLGIQEFNKVWGGRENADNWRRSDKSSLSLDDLTAFNEQAVDSVFAGINDKSRYLKDIPLTPEAKIASNVKIADAYYALGIIYKEKMKDEPRAISAFRNLISRFDTSKHNLNSLYQLYRMYTNQNRADSAGYYRSYILSKYPYSDYAKIIENPEYAHQMSSIKRKTIAAYKKAYYYYDNGFYTACKEMCVKTNRDIKKNHLSVKFDYLMALCAIEDKNKAKLISSLKAFIGSHGGTPEAADAQKRIDLLKAEKKARPVKLAAPKYTVDNSARHLAVMIIPVEGNDIEEIKNRISNYNKAYHATKGYNISSALLDKDNHMISIKQFNNADVAVDYYDQFVSNQSSLKKINQKKYDFFIISYTNYALFFKDKRVDKYIEFYDDNYQL